MIYPTTLFEVGVDEAGRGPLAFEVVACAVIMPTEYAEDDKMVKKIKDSKKISAKTRETLAEYIKENAIAYGVGIATVEEIDEHNILNASLTAMHRALDYVSKKADFNHIFVDGDRFKPYMSKKDIEGDDWVPYSLCIKGDDKYLNIAAASILAKVTRDDMVENYVHEHPYLEERYGFLSNKGYGTAKHIKGIQEYGITEFHRKSFHLHEKK